MEESLNCRAETFFYHVPAGIALAPNAFNNAVIKPTKESVVQLYEHQQLHYSTYGGTVVTYYMTNIFESPSVEELVYYLKEAMIEYSYATQRNDEVVLYQPKQSVKIEGNITFPVYISDSISALNSDLQGLNLQYRYVQRTSLLWSRPCVTDSLYANYKLFDAQLCRANFCKDLTIEHYRPLQQLKIPSYSKYVENNFYGICAIDKESEFALSSNGTDYRSSTQQFHDYKLFPDYESTEHLRGDLSSIIESLNVHNRICINRLFATCTQVDLERVMLNIQRNEPLIERENEDDNLLLNLIRYFLAVLGIR